ncbi:hypothetical protein BV20DRAFT_956837 [Pilatotrama ljubarskyi]|nr:hypothetical protein BV20DRAFT_956837 [Pilatotrama ljubarskyi]
MEEHRGVERGSYIWGRSVHNTRIERLWYDVTSGFGSKWKAFFIDLEQHHGLDATLPSHIWLLHHLYLPSINSDAQEWAEAWNAHGLSLPTGGMRSPRDMFVFGVAEYGAQAVGHYHATNNLEEFGVDWEALRDDRLMAHFREHNNVEGNERDHPFAPHSAPAQLSQVTCDEPGCPYTPEQVQQLDARLQVIADVHATDMAARRTVWCAALQLCLAGDF